MAYEYQKGYFRKCEQNFKKIGTNLRTELYLKESIFENLNLKFTSKYWGEEALDQPYETLPNCYGKIIKIQSGYQHYILKTQKGRLYRFGKSVWETRPSRNNLMGYQYLQINYFQNHRLLVKKIYCGYYSSYFLCSNQDLYYCCNINFRRERSEIEKDLSLLNKEFSQSSKQSEVLLEYNKSDRKLNFVLCEQDVEQCWVNQFVPNFFFVKSLSDDNNLYAMGDNQSYQLAIGLAQIHDTIKYEPVKVPFIDSNEIVDMALSSSYTVIVLKKKSQDKHRVFFAGFEKKFFTTFKEAKELTFLKIVKIVSSKNLSIAKSRNNDFWIFDNRIIKKIPNTNYLAQKKYCFKNFRKFEFNKYPIHSNIKISAGIENKFFFYLKSYNDQDLIDDLLKLLISGLCADLTICDGIKVHKIFVETRLKCKSEMIIDKLKKYKKQTIRNFLKYVYTGKIFNEKYYAIIMRILKKFKLSDLSIKSLKEDLVSLYYDESSIDFNILIKNKTNLNTGTENNNKSSNTNTNKKNNNDDEKNKHNNNKNNTNNNHNNNKSLTINQENVLNNNENDREGEFIKKFNPQSNILNKKSNNQNRKNQNEKNQIKNKNKSLHNFPDGKMKNDNFFESLIKNKNNKKKNNNQKKNKHENRNRNHKSKNNYNTTNNKNKKKTNNNKIPEQSKNNLKNKNCFEILINNKKNIKKNNNQKKNNQKSLIKINNNKKKQAKNNPNYNYNNTKKKKKKKKKKNNVKKLNNNKKNNNDKNNKANNNNNITKKCNSNNKNNNNDEKNKHNKNTNKNKNNTNNNQNNNRGKNDYYYNNNNTTNKNKNDKNNNKNNKAISSRNDNNNNQNNNSKNMECDNNNKNNDRDEKNKHNNNDDDQKNKNKNKNSNNNKGCSGISSFNDNNNNQNNNSKNMECDNNKKNNDRDEKNKRKNNLHIKKNNNNNNKIIMNNDNNKIKKKKNISDDNNNKNKTGGNSNNQKKMINVKEINIIK